MYPHRSRSSLPIPPTDPDFPYEQHLIFEPRCLDGPQLEVLRTYLHRFEQLPAIAAYRKSDRFQARSCHLHACREGGRESLRADLTGCLPDRSPDAAGRRSHCTTDTRTFTAAGRVCPRARATR